MNDAHKMILWLKEKNAYFAKVMPRIKIGVAVNWVNLGDIPHNDIRTGIVTSIDKCIHADAELIDMQCRDCGGNRIGIDGGSPECRGYFDMYTTILNVIDSLEEDLFEL